MENFDVHVISKDIINGVPIATCVVTHDNLFISSVKYDYFSDKPEVDYLNAISFMPPEELKPTNIKKLEKQIELSVFQHFASLAQSKVNHYRSVLL